MSRTLTAISTFVRYTATHFVKINIHMYSLIHIFALFGSLFSIKIRILKIA